MTLPLARLGVWLVLTADGPEASREARMSMGGVALVLVDGAADASRALQDAFAGLDRVEASLTLYRESELTRLNETGGAAQASPDLGAVLAHALDVAAAASGAFDPTAEPLVRATGGLGGPRRTLGDAERRRLLATVGFGRVRFDRATGRVSLEPGTRLDFGGIAKGYAADEALAALRAAGARSGLVDLGGSSLGVFGRDASVYVRSPDRGPEGPWASFRVRDRAVSSSGGDERPGHILDPRTGRPASRVLAASVVAATGIEADALATAVFVLGAEDGLRLLARRGAHGLVLTRKGGRRVIETTPGFAGAFALRPARGVAVRERLLER
jgi:thiamine biosynthesis lipoprotein